jgi:transcription antitermination factor NusG
MNLFPNPARQWYAVRVRSNYEANVGAVLDQKGVEKFLPTYRSRRKWSDRVKTLDLPLFPGYLFCRIPLDERNLVLTTGGVVDIVGVGRIPAPISEEEIEAVRTVVQAHAHAEPWPFLQIGQKVKIKGGALSGLEGILVRVKNSWRLVISVTLLERSVAVEVDAAYVSAAQ